MNQYLQQLNNLAAQNEGGGDDTGEGSSILGYHNDKPIKLYYNPKDKKYYGKSDDGEIYGSPSFDQSAAMQSAKATIRSYTTSDQTKRWSPEEQKIVDKEWRAHVDERKPLRTYSHLAGRYAMGESERAFVEARNAESGTPPSDESTVIQRSRAGRAIESAGNWIGGAIKNAGDQIGDTRNKVSGVFSNNNADAGDAASMQSEALQAPAIDPAQAVQQGAAQQSGGGIVSNPNATAGSAAVSPQGLGTENKGFPGERRSRGFGATWEAPGEAMELTQEDFYPTPEPMVGQYDTGNEYVARSARMPMGALSKAAATLQNRQVELDQKRQAFQEELYKPVKTAAPYQQNFNTIVNKQREDFLQKVAQDLTGGNINKAYREIFSNPRLRAQYRQLNADLEALGQRGAATFDKVINYLNQASTNKIQSTPEQRQLANDIAMGLGGYSAADGTGGSFDKLIKDMNRWDLMEGRDQYFKNTIGPSIKDFFQKTSGWELTGDGRYRFLTTTSKKNWDSHKRQLAVDMAVWQGYGSGDLPEEKIQDNIKYLDNMLGQQVDQDVKHIDTYSNISRGDGDGGQNGPQYSYTAAVRPNPLDPRLGGNDELYFTPSETVGNRQQAVAVSPVRVTYVDPNKPPQTRVLGYPELKFDEVGQDWVITGNDLGNTAETNVTITTPVTIEDAYAQADQVKNMIAKSNKRTQAFASENPDFLRNKYNTTDVYQILSNQLGGAISAEELRKNWGDYFYRKDVKEMLRTRTMPGASTPAPAPSQSTAGTSGASQGTQQSDNIWY